MMARSLSADAQRALHKISTFNPFQIENMAEPYKIAVAYVAAMNGPTNSRQVQLDDAPCSGQLHDIDNDAIGLKVDLLSLSEQALVEISRIIETGIQRATV